MLYQWSGRLHTARTSGRIASIGSKLTGLGVGLMNVFTHFTGFLTGDPGAWINWFGTSKNEVGKIYFHAEKGAYFQIVSKKEFRNSSGEVIRAIVTYDVFDDFEFDSDENKHIGINLLGRFTEDVDVVNKTSTGTGGDLLKHKGNTITVKDFNRQL